MSDDGLRAALLPGARLPDLELPDHNGSLRQLSDLVAGDPTLLAFSRGWWCPKEQTFARGLVRLQEELEVGYARFVTVSVDPPEVQAAFRAGLGARWTFLSDAERVYLDVLELREVADTLHHPYLPACATLRPDLTVHRGYNGYYFWGRPTLEQIRADFRAIAAQVRSDFEPPR